MPGTPITDEDRKQISAKFICTVCNLLLSVPMQTSCGHLMCYACLQTLLESSNPRCPEDQTELKREQVFPDTFTRRELKGVHLHCTNPGCPWHGTYEFYAEHSAVCEYALIDCVHPHCKIQFPRSYLGQHLESECEYRNVKCQYCNKDFPIASIKEHVSTNCEDAPVTCQHCHLKIVRSELKQHEKQDCEEIPGTCEFQAVGCKHVRVSKRKELRQHSNDSLINHVWLVLQFVLSLASQLTQYVPRLEFSGMIQKVRDDISEVRVALAEKFVTLLEKMTGLERRIDSLESTGGGGSRIQAKIEDLAEKGKDIDADVASLRERNMNLEREVREKISIIDRLKNRIDQLDESLALNAVKISDLESARDSSQIPHSYNGTLLWKIDQFQRKRQDAISGVKTALYSPHFYSSQFGYKMGAKIYMNGDGFGKGSHLSLFFVVMKGEYDALQTWPFQKKITMMLLDQGSGDHMIDAFHSDPQSSSFQRPKSDMNIASGSPLFMPLDGLKNRTYIKDDVIFIKIIVD